MPLILNFLLLHLLHVFLNFLILLGLLQFNYAFLMG